MNRGLVLCALMLTASAQETQEPIPPVPSPEPPRTAVTLRQCVHLALENNLEIEVARFVPLLKEQDISTAWEPFDPVAYFEASGGERLTPTSSSLSGATVLDNDTFDFNTGVRSTLPFGPSWDFSFRGSRLNTNNSFATLNPSWSEALGLTLTLPLLKGAGTASAHAPVLIARLNREASLGDFEKTLNDSLFAVEKAYWTLVGTSEIRKVREKSLEVARRLAEDRRKMLEAGAGNVTRLDVTQAESQVAQQLEALLRAENDVQDAVDQLKLLTNPKLLKSSQILAPAEEPRTAETPIDEEAALQRSLTDALMHRADHRSLQRQIEGAEVLLGKHERDSKPKLDLTGTATLTGLDQSFGNAFDDVLTTDGRELTAGVVLEVPLGNEGPRGRRTKAELDLHRIRLMRENLQNTILVEVRAAVREVRTTEERLKATAEARRLAQEQADAEWERRAAGLRTTFHVLQAQEDLTEALTNEIQARIDYTLALSDLRRVTGTLLPAYDIRVERALPPRSR